MPRTFTETEVEVIRKQLLEKGSHCFSRYGLRKTGIEDITKLVGIGKGTFYNFFNSKEDLFVEVLKHEVNIRRKFMDDLLESDLSAQEYFKALMTFAADYIETKRHIIEFYIYDAKDILKIKLPRGQYEELVNDDVRILHLFFKKLLKKNQIKKQKIEILVGIIRAFCFVCYHKQNLGVDNFDEFKNILINLIADGLTRDEKSTS
jgi:AcrR family transcriptional regulator